MPQAMHTLLMSITGGISWVEVIEPLKDIRADLVPVFTSYMAFSLFAVLNVMTGVFCHEAISSARQQEDVKLRAMMRSNNETMAAIRKIFGHLDRDQSGHLTYKELAKHCEEHELDAIMQSLDLQPSDLWLLFKILDQNEDSNIDSDEFVTGCMRLKGPAKAFELASLHWDLKRLTDKMHSFMVYAESRFEYMTTGVVNDGMLK